LIDATGIKTTDFDLDARQQSTLFADGQTGSYGVARTSSQPVTRPAVPLDDPRLVVDQYSDRTSWWLCSCQCRVNQVMV
jgi:hypothetical protein